MRSRRRTCSSASPSRRRRRSTRPCSVVVPPDPHQRLVGKRRVRRRARSGDPRQGSLRPRVADPPSAAIARSWSPEPVSIDTRSAARPPTPPRLLDGVRQATESPSPPRAGPVGVGRAGVGDEDVEQRGILVLGEGLDRRWPDPFRPRQPITPGRESPRGPWVPVWPRRGARPPRFATWQVLREQRDECVGASGRRKVDRGGERHAAVRGSARRSVPRRAGRAPGLFPPAELGRDGTHPNPVESGVRQRTLDRLRPRAPPSPRGPWPHGTRGPETGPRDELLEPVIGPLRRISASTRTRGHPDVRHRTGDRDHERTLTLRDLEVDDPLLTGLLDDPDPEDERKACGTHRLLPGSVAR